MTGLQIRLAVAYALAVAMLVLANGCGGGGGSDSRPDLSQTPTSLVWDQGAWDGFDWE